MAGTLSWGLLIMLAGLAIDLFASVRLVRWARYRGHVQGTPHYAEARLARRSGLYALLLGFVLIAVGAFLWTRGAPVQ